MRLSKNILSAKSFAAVKDSDNFNYINDYSVDRIILHFLFELQGHVRHKNWHNILPNFVTANSWPSGSDGEGRWGISYDGH